VDGDASLFLSHTTDRRSAVGRTTTYYKCELGIGKTDAAQEGNQRADTFPTIQTPPFVTTMPACWNLKALVSIAIVIVVPIIVQAHVPRATVANSRLARTTTAAFLTTAQQVEVCGFKDCKRAGGGPRLQKLVAQVLEEEGLTDTVTVAACDCQGECGYGPNMLVDGKLVNDVRGRNAVIQALGISSAE